MPFATSLNCCPHAAKSRRLHRIPRASVRRPRQPPRLPRPPRQRNRRTADSVDAVCPVEWSSRWRLVAGGVMLKDFGRRESEARLALRLIRELRLNQHGIIGARRLCLSIGFQMAYRRGPAVGLRVA